MQSQPLDKTLNRTYFFRDYDPNWIVQFESIKQTIGNAFGPKALRIEHVGSTSIPGMQAKPIIDALIIVDDVHDLAKETQSMVEAGYEWGENYIAPDTLIFFKTGPDGEKLENIHVCQQDSYKAKQFLVMRDFFRAFPEKAQAYSDLKKANSEKHPDDYIAYRAAKKPFLDEMEKEAYAWVKNLG